MKKFILKGMSCVLILTLLSGCHSSETTKKVKKVKKTSKTEDTAKETEEPSDRSSDPSDSSNTDSSDPGTSSTDPGDSSGTIGGKVVTPGSAGASTVFELLACRPGNEINQGNDIQRAIAELTDCEVRETWAVGATAEEIVGSVLASGDLPDFIDGESANHLLYEAQVLVPWDEYLDNPQFSNLRELYTDKEWEMFRQSDGHIYWCNTQDAVRGKPRTTTYTGNAFWIQVRVLEWAGYPLIETVNEYFDLIEAYYEAHPTEENGDPIIPFTFMSEDWRGECFASAPSYMSGYLSEDVAVIDYENYDKPTVLDYNNSKETQAFYRELNKAYSKDLIDKDFPVQSYDEYAAKIISGHVLGMCDWYWDSVLLVADEFKRSDLSDMGCEYVPLGLTIENDLPNYYSAYSDGINYSAGVGVTTSCQDVDKAFWFLNRLLDQDVHDLRFWGIEGVDYLVDDDGYYYRDDGMRANWKDTSYIVSHTCSYSTLPWASGTSRDGKNAMIPSEQTSEFFVTLSEPVQTCFKAYDYESYVDFLRSSPIEVPVWHSLRVYANSFTTSTPFGQSFVAISECRKEYLPQLVTTGDFDEMWDKYMKAYDACDPDFFISALQDEVDRLS
ncbi:MAG: sugar ABC transporter substrate-binding protein [Clostridiales bacterium]|nr:sugar ABC transporter substrate-binding protein [Clostridiales bacterium]